MCSEYSCFAMRHINLPNSSNCIFRIVHRHIDDVMEMIAERKKSESFLRIQLIMHIVDKCAKSIRVIQECRNEQAIKYINEVLID